jgi:hypothetical protein
MALECQRIEKSKKSPLVDRIKINTILEIAVRGLGMRNFSSLSGPGAHLSSSFPFVTFVFIGQGPFMLKKNAF